jgi:hypothetical protein
MRHREIARCACGRRSPFLLLAAALLTAPLSAAPQMCTSGPPTQIGTATLLAAGLASASPLPNTTIDILRIDCEGLQTVGCALQITEPPAGVPLRGTILFSSGAQGFAYFGGETLGLPLLVSLQALGFRLVDRAWAPGWFTTGGSVRKQSCRYATMLRWVYDNLHTTGPFFAFGSSGGCAEIAYSLTTWGGDDLIDVAVLAGGPPLARLDLQCPEPINPTWAAQCRSLIPSYLLECTPMQCIGQGGFGLCTTCAQHPTAEELREDSILHTTAKTTLRTRVHVLLGAGDCSNTAPSAALFFAALTAEKAFEMIPGAGHPVVETSDGRDACVRAILAALDTRPGPATLAFVEWPHVGGPYDLELHGPPGAPYLGVLGNDYAQVEIQQGWLFLIAPIIPVGSGLLDASTGRATLTFFIPPDPSLAGRRVLTQALVGGWLTNVVHAQVLP